MMPLAAVNAASFLSKHQASWASARLQLADRELCQPRRPRFSLRILWGFSKFLPCADQPWLEKGA